MNHTPVYGWYYYDSDSRAPAWSSVRYLHRFLTTNTGPGPYAKEVPISGALPGDIIQISTWMEDFHHTLVVVEARSPADEDNIFVACHSYDSDNRVLSSYDIKKIRCMHIVGVRG
jgi:hypothetical protein